MFQVYFLALFADKEYTQVLDRIYKLDKLLRSDPTLCASNIPQDTPGPFGRPSLRSQRVIFFIVVSPDILQQDVSTDSSRPDLPIVLRHTLQVVVVLISSSCFSFVSFEITTIGLLINFLLFGPTFYVVLFPPRSRMAILKGSLIPCRILRLKTVIP